MVKGFEWKTVTANEVGIAFAVVPNWGSYNIFRYPILPHIWWSFWEIDTATPFLAPSGPFDYWIIDYTHLIHAP